MCLFPEYQYYDLIRKITVLGVEDYNERTKSNVKVLLNQTIKWDASRYAPIIRARRINWKAAVAEMLGYLKGYTSTEQFNKLGTKTWDANANNPNWVNSPFYGVYGDMGLIYGAVGNEVPLIEPSRLEPYSGRFWTWGKVPVLKNLVNNIINHKDDRGLIWSFWNPGMFHLGCLRPCMYEHQFHILGGKLHLTSTMRSCDVMLGLTFNMLQCHFLLTLMASISGLEIGTVHLHLNNAHIYENQFDSINDVLMNAKDLVFSDSDIGRFKFEISDEIKTYDDIVNKLTLEHIRFDEYDKLRSNLPIIKIPFTL